MSNFETTYLGLHLKNPLVAASSGLTSSVEKIKELEKAGIGAVVLKSIFEEQINNEVSSLLVKEQQNMDYPEAEDYIKGYLRDNSINDHIELLEESKKVVDIPVIASINCVSADEWTTFAKDFENAGADAIELNIFYVPTDRNEKPGVVEQLYLDVLKKVKSVVSIPVAVKFGVNHSNIIGMADKLKANGASGIVMFNRFYEPDINLETLALTSSEVFSSPSELRRSLRWVGLVSSAVPTIDIAASTGIHDGSAVIKQLLAGAQVTQLCSSLYINGASVIAEMLDEMSGFMKKWNFKKPDDFRGRLSYKNIPDPMLYERSQFMKYFSNRK
ncbi:MAG: dihydroorotate dehydrogenase-like protein [Prolixibacteraceae bacterium]|jgi:dihydroorotate dehydrogenase (fumarate)|nr:dihydroorotate dehydrogenase-like protein [Prolixibacteraceae bacterium]MBT6765043.1 dihydroorotate dehydrogenase-like protein [Prolixibacteraceae bacterium]MBT7000160.1 dihydroorotate dehydrogenase-like protein [Prolixibacteraceae bacterium]MBT7395650.1 dihydroorotate dehydrogenase-like protein [Prolixibacteraceae bacterium]